MEKKNERSPNLCQQVDDHGRLCLLLNTHGSDGHACMFERPELTELKRLLVRLGVPEQDLEAEVLKEVLKLEAKMKAARAVTTVPPHANAEVHEKIMGALMWAHDHPHPAAQATTEQPSQSQADEFRPKKFLVGPAPGKDHDEVYRFEVDGCRHLVKRMDIAGSEAFSAEFGIWTDPTRSPTATLLKDRDAERTLRRAVEKERDGLASKLKAYKEKEEIDQTPANFGSGPIDCRYCGSRILWGEGGIVTHHFHMDSCYGHDQSERAAGLHLMFRRERNQVNAFRRQLEGPSKSAFIDDIEEALDVKAEMDPSWMMAACGMAFDYGRTWEEAGACWHGYVCGPLKSIVNPPFKFRACSACQTDNPYLAAPWMDSL